MTLHPRFPIAALKISVESTTVNCRAEYTSGGHGETISGVGSATSNGISIRVVAVERGKARAVLPPA